MRDPHHLATETVLSIHGQKSQTYSPSAITDLHDIHVYGYFPSDSMVGFLVRGSKDLPGTPGPGKSPAGIDWRDYHNYIAEFDRDGSYKKSVELPMTYQLAHLAILSSGEFLVSGYDRLNSAARLLFLDSSGQILRSLDMPAARKPVGGNAPYGSVRATMAPVSLMGSIVFTPYGQDILVWRMNSSDPVLDVGPGASVREVPLQTPPGSVFVGMIAANDRWVAHFRSSSTPNEAPLSPTGYSYYELRPQDASLSTKLMQSGNVPLAIACESDGNYIAFKRDKDGKLMLLKAD